MELWFILAIGAVFVISILIYVFLMLFYPEWVGITGKVALNAEASHREETETTNTEENSQNSTDQKVDAAKSENTPS